MMIREIGAQDRADWLRMRRALWPDCSEAMHGLEARRYAETGGDAVVLVHRRDAGEGTGLGGFIEVSIRDRVDGSFSDRVAYIEGWYVDPDLRGRRLGRRLIEAAEAWARERGLTELASDAELDNTEAIRAHEALGFRETFRLVHYLKEIRR